MSRWREVTIGEVCAFTRGLTYKKQDEVDESSNAVLRANNISLETGKLNFEEIRYIRDDIAVPPSKKVRKDSLLICTASGSKSHLGKVALIDDDYDYAFGGFMGLLTPSSEVVPKYLYWMTQSPIYSDYIAALSDGVNINNLKFSQLAEFRFPLPPLAEQKRIVAMLDAAFAAIDAATAHARQNLTNARELFESLLDSVFAAKGGDWPRYPLGEMTVADTRITYGVVKPGPEGTVRFVRGGDVNQGRITTDRLRTITEEVSAQYKRTLLRGGEILVSLVGQPGQSAVVPTFLAGANIARQVGLVRLRDEFDPDYVCFFLRSRTGLSALGARESGSVQQVINLCDLRPVEIPIPDLSVQRGIVDALKNAEERGDQLASLYTRKLALLAELKQSILQKAFSGEVVADGTPDAFLFPGLAPEQDTRELYAGVLAIAYRRHERRGKLATLGDIKREKIIHLVEAHFDLSLGRTAYKIAAGPADLDRRDAVEALARERGWFSVEETPKGHHLIPGEHFDSLLRAVREALGHRLAEIEAFIDLLAPKNTRQAEIVATAYAAWKNLLLDGRDPTIEEIIYEGRENWHPAKLDITPDEFRVELNWMRSRGVVPSATGRQVLRLGESA